MKKIKSIGKQFNYTWVILALCFLVVLTGLGFCSSNRSLYLSAITEALDIKRSVFSIADSLRFIITAIVNLFFGTLIGRFGAKKLMSAGILSLIVSTLIHAYATNVFEFYIGGIILGIGLCWTSTTMVGYIVNKWCKEKKGTIMGAILGSQGIGSAIAVQIIVPLIYQEGNAFGYRDAYKLIVLLLCVVLLLVLLFFREKPTGEEANSSQIEKKSVRGQNWTGIEYKEIRKMPYFYLAAICIFFTGFILQGVQGVYAAHMRDVGLDAAYIATVASIQSILLAGSKFLTGILYDKFGLRLTMTICDVTAFMAMLSLALLSSTPSGRALAMVYAITSSLSLPLDTIMLPIFANDLFGQKSYNKILGLFSSLCTAGYAFSYPIINGVFDICGSYKPVLLAGSVMTVAITVIFQYVVTVSNRQRKVIMKSANMES